ncbi:MAG: hypothetical protein JXN10_07600 [Clostridia bacterium]|nr:hypothetical protein [Clostridia bacterium]MBN2883377.1 hypothetical protein [Clostridia bacterium]
MKNKIIRKFIPLMAITASVGGLSAAAMELAGSKTSIWVNLIIGFIYILAGTLAGMILTEFFEKKGAEIVARNQKGELLITKQPAYLLAGFAVLAALLMNLKSGVGFAIVAALFLGFNFLMGITNGIFDYRESVTKNLLYGGVVPIGMLLIYSYYLNNSENAIRLAWMTGSLYLYTYLLFINRMQLDSIIFFRKSVNIEDSRKIRVKNDIMITAYYSIYLILFNFRKMVTITREMIERFISWFFMVLEKISDWLIADIPFIEREPMDQVEDLVEGEVVVRPAWVVMFMKILMYTLLAAVCIVLLLAIIGFIVKLVKKIRESMRLSYNRKANETRTSSDEYVEETEIVKEERNNSSLRARKKKMIYNLRDLGKIPLASDKVRYLYGFVLERLYHRHISIKDSDTPEEVLDKVKAAGNGANLTKMGFAEFTESYERVRYGRKNIALEENMIKKGEGFEKAIASMTEEKK